MPLSSSRLRALAAAASVLVLGACTTVGPNFKTPAAPQGAAASGYAMTGDAPAPGVRLSPDARTAGAWWQAFGSPELDAVERQAFADSPTLAEATATLQRAQANAAAIEGRQKPQIDANGSIQRERINVQSFGFTSFPNPTIYLFSIGGAVSYDLDVFGGRRRATEQARAQAEAELRRADAAYLTLSGNIALEAMRIASLRTQVATVQRIIADDQRTIELVRRATQAGGEAPASIVNPQAALAEDQALLPPLERELEAARHQMALLVGKSPAEWTAPDFNLASFTAPAQIPVTLPSTLVRNRPDILAAEADLHAATAAVGVAVANQYPNISLSAGLTQAAIHPEQIFNYASSGWSLLGGVTAPIFHGGALAAQRREAEAEARASMARYQQTVLRAFVQVSDALAALGTDQQSIAALQQSVRAAEANARNSETAYNLGGGSLLQVVDAQRRLSAARRALAQLQGQQFSDLVSLYAATATDWRSAT